MRKILPRFSGRPQQRGVSVIAAVFLLLLMASLAAFMVNLSSVSHANLAADIGGERAYQAARAGVEWGMYQLDPNSGEANVDSINCPAAGAPTVPNHGVVVQCTAYPLAGGHYTEGSKSIRIFRIVAVATATGAKAPGIERQIEVTVEKCRDSSITAAPFDC